MALVICWVTIPLNFGVYLLWIKSQLESMALFATFATLCLVQFVAGVAAFVGAVRAVKKARADGVRSSSAVWRAVMAVLGGLGGPSGFLLGLLPIALAGAGGGWGRPLRVRGRQVHPELTEGADWSAGEAPDASALDLATRRALEGLWLHDAQKEHASVPAFSRLSWLLAAVGGPAELMAWSHRAALEEIDHAQRCFALAAGYGGRAFTVEPMPELLVGGLGDVKDPVVTLAVESLKDGCLLEDFNADIAARCAAGCEEPATRRLLEQIAREERSHADFSWAVIEWALKAHRARVVPALERGLTELAAVQRPTSANAEKQALVERADAAALRRHGRLDDAEWAEAWARRLELTKVRVQQVLNGARAIAA